MKQCPRCNSFSQDDSTRCGVCGWDFSSGHSVFPSSSQTGVPQVTSPLAQSQPQAPQLPILTSPEAHGHKAYIVMIGILLIAVIVLGVFVAINGISVLRNAPVHPNSYPVSTARSSSNWSGFIVCCNSSMVTDVVGSWTVPEVSCSSLSSSTLVAGEWVGIDGATNTSSTVEQIGTASRCEPGNSTAVYYAWYDWYPARSRRLLNPYPVVPGDVVTGEVMWDGYKFIASLRDPAQDWRFETLNTTIALTALRASAEWILEAPSNATTLSVLPLANFGKVFFQNCSATVGASSGPMGTFQLIQDTMVDSNSYVKARPMLPFYNDGTSFSIWWVRPGP